ncbi:MAG: VCBS repeat-containing protein [Chloroflexota bacterium]|nr:VCBS repeat-containing protein [Chloroflexota bacterium]
MMPAPWVLVCIAFVLSGCASSTVSSPAASASVALTTDPLPAAPGFSAGESFPVGPDPVNVAVADLDRDGSLDLVTASESKGVISILLGHGDGTFDAPGSAPGPRASFVAAVDIDGDATPDLLAAGGKTVSVLIGIGDGSFTKPVSYQIQGGLAHADAFWLDTGDLNGDAAPDVVVAVNGGSGPEGASGQLAVLLNTGRGTFAEAVFYPDPSALAVVAEDLDGDGDLDAATANFDSKVRVFAGDGSGRFGAPSEYEIGTHGAAIVAGDLDNDDIPDLLTGDDGGNSISVLIGKDDGSFGQAQILPAGNTHTVAMADLDRDGNLDLLAGGYTDTDVKFWRGSADGTFVATAGVALGDVTARGLAAADLNGDGKLDLAIADALTSIHIFLAK